MISKLWSVLPSSTRMISYGRPQRVRVSVHSRCSSTSDGASLRTGMTTLGSITTAILSVPAALRFAPDEKRREAGRQHPDEHERRLGAVDGQVVGGVVAVAVRQKPEDRVANAAPDRNRRRQSNRADADDAGQQNEDLERRRRRQQGRDEY